MGVGRGEAIIIGFGECILVSEEYWRVCVLDVQIVENG